MNIKNISIKYLFLANLLVVVLIVVVLFSAKLITPVLAQSAGDDSPDALAVRVIANPHHLSAQSWYQLQGFSGSPQSLIVDGYKAVRDGRTVYVSATNVDANNLYTNIYLISYDQQADQKTVDIFGRILKNWKFNTNLSLDQQIGKCLISNKSCKVSSDCPDGYSCGNEGEPFRAQANKCVIKETDSQNIKNTPACILDSDCPQNLFCSGLKAKIVRDLDRLEKIVLLKEKIQAYYNINRRYPILGSGTYLPHVAISAWPSWQNSFLNQVGAGGISDPINKLGSCYDAEGKFNLDTCWNPVDNVFFLNSYNGSPVNHSNFILPPASYAITYLGNANGSDYKMCATMETALGGNNYVLASGGTMSSNSCAVSSLGGDFNIGSTGASVNTAPYISEKNLSGVVGTEFLAYVKAVDAENHPIFWNITSNSSLSTWGSPLTIIDTSNPNQKIIKSTYAGAPGNYTLSLRLTDSLGSSTVENLTIKIESSAPQLVVGDMEYNLSYGSNFSQDININFAEKLGGSTQKSVALCFLNTSDNCTSANTFYINSEEEVDIKNGLGAKLIKSTENNWQVKLSSFISDSLPLGTFKYKAIVKDSYNEISEKTFTIKILANKPIINFNNCLKVAELGSNYTCTLKTNDQNEGAIFSLVPGAELPGGLSLNITDKTNQVIVGGLTSLLDNYEIKVIARNKYGLDSDVGVLKLSVVSSCGSYLVQHPGGPWNSAGTVRNHGGYYKTALVGNQCWLQDNLNVGVMISSSSVPQIDNIYDPLNPNTIEKYCLDNSSINCDVYGGLYTFSEATNRVGTTNIIYTKRGICPPGFRVALNSDWDALETSLGTGAGTKIIYSGQNDFRALFGFYADKAEVASPFVFPPANSTSSARFMSIREVTGGDSAYRGIEKDQSSIYSSPSVTGNLNAFYVRCVKGDDGVVTNWGQSDGNVEL